MYLGPAKATPLSPIDVHATLLSYKHHLAYQCARTAATFETCHPLTEGGLFIYTYCGQYLVFSRRRVGSDVDDVVDVVRCAGGIALISAVISYSQQ